MTYLVRWGTITDGDNPFEAARKALEIANSPQGSAWHITDMSTGAIVVVDVQREEVLHPCTTPTP